MALTADFAAYTPAHARLESTPFHEYAFCHSAIHEVLASGPKCTNTARHRVLVIVLWAVAFGVAFGLTCRRLEDRRPRGEMVASVLGLAAYAATTGFLVLPYAEEAQVVYRVEDQHCRGTIGELVAPSSEVCAEHASLRLPLTFAFLASCAWCSAIRRIASGGASLAQVRMPWIAALTSVAAVGVLVAPYRAEIESWDAHVLIDTVACRAPLVTAASPEPEPGWCPASDRRQRAMLALGLGLVAAAAGWASRRFVDHPHDRIDSASSPRWGSVQDAG